MTHRSNLATGAFCALVVVAGALVPVANGQSQSAEKRKLQADENAKRRVDEGPAVIRRPDAERRAPLHEPDSFRRRTPTQKSYVRTRRDYNNVRVIKRPRYTAGGIVDRRVIVRSTRVSPVIIERFAPPRRSQIESVIRFLRAGDTAQAVRVWGNFVDGLSDYAEPIDLDDLMLYVAREGSIYMAGDLLIHARRLEYLNEAVDNLEDYVVQLYEMRRDCSNGSRKCGQRTLALLEEEIFGSRRDLARLQRELRAAEDEFDERLHGEQRYDNQFATTFDRLYGEVVVRIQINP